ncbi:sodium/proton antiporter, NhaA family [Candidatus Koribacter versatilis Ellin345]|uniref:Na(+)/H(+) antiporter NhaA n=1 Tax=Koribacter versatilis (strain Ellin345) TaxID=204669 RepID=NHAA_KORVE|nr:Na+/H+ antiporter NhaA [Candidatus Koribacter versatilis]Q1IJ81.1 RecName: Full=Na(+)/H(+) antiporter NhaA; AltName: Full=Sodium/proton antiporter NhaA [Candidatus Koribacter versatilis Ellin345]ABF43069.1 sodium/proton antiporter, NhaA family [Candidatus Koribacter versatilis Ellin345]
MSEAFDSRASKALPIEVLISPFVRFARMEAASGILLIVSTAAALVWANSPWKSSYDAIWDVPMVAGVGNFLLTESRHHWINDGLMSIFFFLVGLEIKREVLIGELTSLRNAAFPLIAAVGGTVVPAVIYLLCVGGGVAQKGWGIPMATDIAFALGVLILLGNRIPPSLRVFVTALAIVDDIIAVLVIALFYTHEIHLVSLLVALGGVGIAFGFNLLGISKPSVYALIGVCIWAAVLKSGVHATVAGVLLAFTIPARNYLDRDFFVKRGRWLLERFEKSEPHSFESHTAIHTLQHQCDMIESPLHRLEHGLQPWVSFLIMPLFAFSNAGVRFIGNIGVAVKHPVSIGVALGLFLGKPLGIWLFAWLAVKSRVANAPPELSWWQIFGASWICGIGFTMSLFIASLAFGYGNLLDMSKIGTLAASLVAGVCGSVVLWRRSALGTSEPPVSPATTSASV